MHAEYFFIDEGCDRHGVEDIDEVLPDFQIIATLALIHSQVH